MHLLPWAERLSFSKSVGSEMEACEREKLEWKLDSVLASLGALCSIYEGQKVS
jgi:hypothetical protein